MSSTNLYLAHEVNKMNNLKLPKSVRWTFEHIPGCRIVPCSKEGIPMCSWMESFPEEFKNDDAGRFEENTRDTAMFAILTKHSTLVVIDSEVTERLIKMSVCKISAIS